MAESWTLDPDGTALGLNTSAIKIRDPGFAVQGPIKASLSETIDGEGSPSLSQQYENWTISGSLVVANVGSVTVESALNKLGQAADRAMREGVEIERVLSSGQGGSTLRFDVESFEIEPQVVKADLVRASECEVAVTMEARPLARMAELTQADHTETTLPVLIFTESTIKGQAPGLGRLVIDNDSTSQHQRFVAGGIQSRFYSSADTAALYYQAEHLKPLGTAATAAPSTSATYSTAKSGSGWVKSTNLGPTWSGVLETMCSTLALATTSTAHMTHVGSYQVWARVQQPSANSTGVQVRLDWSPGDSVDMTENDPVDVTVEDDFQLCNLGLIHIPEAKVGSNRWVGRVNARSVTSGDEIYVDDFRLLPVDEGYFEVRTPLNISAPPASLSARSEFTTESGVITGDALAVGGTWTVITNSDATDFSEAGDICTRTAVSDTGTAGGVINTGRGVYASTPTTLTDTIAQIDLKSSAMISNLYNYGLLLRVDNAANDMLVAEVIPSTGTVVIAKVVAGVQTTLGQVTLENNVANVTYRLVTYVTAGGFVQVFYGLASSTPPLVLSVTDPALATGGTLASGTVGFWDVAAAATANTRTFANFAAWAPVEAHAIPKAQSMQWRYDGALREDDAGQVWVPEHLDGDPCLPPASGREGRDLRGIVMASRGDPRSGEADSGIDDISARLFYQPRILTIPTT